MLKAPFSLQLWETEKNKLREYCFGASKPASAVGVGCASDGIEAALLLSKIKDQGSSKPKD